MSKFNEGLTPEELLKLMRIERTTPRMKKEKS